MSTFYTTSDAARILSVSTQRVRTLCRDGKLEAEKIGTTWLIDSDSIQQYGIRTSHMVAQDHPTYSLTTKKPFALSFFSGAMGLDIGIEEAGFHVLLACEADKFCRQTIALNRPDVALLGDINQYGAMEVREAAGLQVSDDIDLIVGGPPCQAFSTAGKRKGFDDERGNVFLKYLEICLDLRPKYFVIENVRGLLSAPMSHRPHNLRGSEFPDLCEDELKGGALNFILNRLEASGYGFSFNLYNSANFGVPQTRERVIIICSRDGKKPPFLVPTHAENGAFGLKKWKKLKSVTKDLKNHDYIKFPEKRIKYYKMLKPGENWKSLPVELQKEAMGNSYYAGGGKTGFLRRLSWEKPSPTLVTHPAMPATDLAHPDENRPLSIQEYKRIQEFPDTWQLAGGIVQQYKQIGNAVPIGLGKAVGVMIRKMIAGTEIECIPGFRYSRYKNTSDTDWRKNFDKNRQLHTFSYGQQELDFG